MVDHKMHEDQLAKNSSSFTLKALPENFAVAQEKVRDFLSPYGCKMRTLLELDMIVEEIFINIASYAYGENTGSASIDLSVDQDENTFLMTFRDSGIPYDPLRKESPDLTSGAMERAVGGLGIFLVQKYADGMSYEYKDGQNCLTIRKKLS
ncbi:MAG TPA: ATP-binding protein [Lachnospiraceae bacterium]|nr:ATP-binding protein [Lachnospiraceae bacterium]